MTESSTGLMSWHKYEKTRTQEKYEKTRTQEKYERPIYENLCICT